MINKQTINNNTMKTYYESAENFLFQFSYVPGMVGEEHLVVTAYHMETPEIGKPPVMNEVTYQELREYAELNSFYEREERETFENLIYQLSPEAIAERDFESNQEAISFVI